MVVMSKLSGATEAVYNGNGGQANAAESTIDPDRE